MKYINEILLLMYAWVCVCVRVFFVSEFAPHPRKQSLRFDDRTLFEVELLSSVSLPGSSIYLLRVVTETR